MTLFIAKNCNSTSLLTSLASSHQMENESKSGLIFGFLSESKAEIFATAGEWRSEMHVSKMEGSWNLSKDESGLKFRDAQHIFANKMMPKESITAASDLDLKMAITVSSTDLNCTNDTLRFVQFGESLRGSDYDDFAALRVTEIAKLKAKGLIAEKVKFEFACVLPGTTAATVVDGHVYVNEPRLVIALDMFNYKIKGMLLHSRSKPLCTASEIRRLLHILAILGMGNYEQSLIESECLVANLQTLECKVGCMNCNGNELVSRLATFYDHKHFEHGKCLS